MTLEELQDVLEAMESGDGMTYAIHLVYREIERRKRGPFTLVEVVASGYIRRPCWPDGCYATSIRPCLDEEGLEFSDGRGLFPVGVLDLTAVDYEAKPIDNTEETKESEKR